MNVKEKTALTTLFLNALLTLFKFLLFLFSGSLAVLAEAWHSFSDIVTSLLVFIAVRGKPNQNGEVLQADGAGDSGGQADPQAGPVRRKITLEQAVSLGIGLFLFVVALLLISKFFSPEIRVVNNPLLSGIIFLIFSLGSYLVSRFETTVGKQQNSLGLVSDGMHTRTDMVASLMTGFSLILYHLGWDIDRWVAGLIALFVLSYAVETAVNVAISMKHGEGRPLFQYRSYTLLARLFSPSFLVWAGKNLDERLHISFFSRKAVRRAPKIVGLLALAAAMTGWVSTCFFTVGPSEQALVERFGRPCDPANPLGPGLHFKAPWPVDRAVIADTETVRRLNVGNITDSNTFALLWTQKHGTELPFLSGDNNYFYPYLVLHYRIKNLYDYYYGHQDPEGLLEGVAHQVAGKLFATRSFFEIALDFRPRLVDEMQKGIQDVLDQEKIRAGIEILAVAVKDVHPPIVISDAYEMVIASIQEKERMINEAMGYRNQNLPEKRGESERLRKEAEGYSLELPLKAAGDAEKFLRQLPGSEEVEAVTRIRLYLAAMLETLANRSKVVFDPKAGSPELWLNTRERAKSQLPPFDGPPF